MNKNSSGNPEVAGKPPFEFAATAASSPHIGLVAPPGRSRRFRVDVGTIVSAVALAQSLLLVSLGYWGSQRLVSTIGVSAHKANHDRTEDRVRAFLGKAESVVDAVASAPSLRPTGERSSELLWTLLQQSPELDSLYVTDEEGQMLMALRYPVPAIRLISRGPAFTTETWQYKLPLEADSDVQNRYVTQRVEAYRSSYDPTLRSWYLQARVAQGPVWTKPYVFAAAQELGVTYALPSRRRYAEGSTQALVVAGDVSLGRLSEFVRVFSSDGYGDSAVLSADFQVLARSDMPGVMHRLTPPSGVLGALHAQRLAAGTASAGDDTDFAFTYEGRRYLVQTSRIPSTGWQLVSWVPEDMLLGGLRRAVLWSLLLALAFLGAALFMSLKLSKLVTAPVENLSRIARRIGLLELDNLPREPSRVLEIQHLDQALDDSARSLKAFSKFVPVNVINQLIDAGHTLAPSGSPRRVTVMFTDVEGFTSISESLDTDVLVGMLTEYFNLAAGVFARHGGVIDKFIGDGIMVLWGAPADLKDAEYKACLAALELHVEMSELNRKWLADGLPEFRTRIGMHTGVVIAGVLGANDRLSYTAFGDVVNVASRIEGINKQLGTQMLMSEVTFEGLKGRLCARRIEELVELRGRQTRMVLYELQTS
ncbi:adenylate/guanylate cyclase domain-containing protein [Variovorax sp. KBW07]|uniref:adenylate/guanylate cyclase domain-containing protein n=1 Tax=Variovorax sp. KBW07 TaxID=2153358 RepID=UPI000F580B88|nr:adenylate/guanylate cyclase domain-containing protein [Variovorax sp. KBW07]RQO42814.1 adenylate/guanylate cyclase domain-containing protein [Variovorax sp. KBW07]